MANNYTSRDMHGPGIYRVEINGRSTLARCIGNGEWDIDPEEVESFYCEGIALDRGYNKWDREEPGFVERLQQLSGRAIQPLCELAWRELMGTVSRIELTPRFITVNGLQVPEPVKTYEEGQSYWMACVDKGGPAVCFTKLRQHALSGRAHKGREDAMLHAKAMVNFN